jgi:GcvH upstream region-like protein
MLEFFRKCQKTLFFIVAIVTIISFCFFGTYQTMGTQEEIPDRKFGATIDGSAFSEKEVKGLAHLLGRSVHLADEFILKDFFETGLAETLVEPYFEFLKEEMQTRLNKVKHYRSYTHPRAPFLNAETMWQHFAPALSQDLSLLKMSREEPSLETFTLLAKTYLDQASFPPEMLKRVLMHQQSQFSWIPQDPHLSAADLSLFGFHSVEDWFGEKFVTLMSELIVNVAIVAEQKGYRVSLEEAYADLLQNTYRALHAKVQQQHISTENALHYLRHELEALGLDQSRGIALWQKILLFRRVFNEIGESVFLDPLIHSKFSHFAQEKCVVDLYRLPSSLQLKNFRALLKFQLYLEAIAPKMRSLALPKTFFTVKEVEKHFPELVEQRFNVDVVHVKEETLAEAISLRETWDFELDEKNWALLKAQFPVLTHAERQLSREERLKALDALEEAERLKVDQFARHQIILARPQMIEEALQNTPPKVMPLNIRAKSESFPLEGIEDPQALKALFERAPLKAAYEPLQRYTQDQSNYYRFSLIDRSSSKEIMTFAGASQEDILDRLLDTRLEEAYPEMRKKDPASFQREGGGFKSFAEVKDQIGAKVYGDLLKMIEEKHREVKGNEKSLNAYATHRLLSHIKEAKLQLQASAEADAFISRQSDAREEFTSQWRLVKQREEVVRSAPFILDKEKLFSLKEGEFSELSSQEPGDIAFCQLIEKKQEDQVMTEEELEAVKRPLAAAARRAFLKQLLAEIIEKKAIDLSNL